MKFLGEWILEFFGSYVGDLKSALFTKARMKKNAYLCIKLTTMRWKTGSSNVGVNQQTKKKFYMFCLDGDLGGYGKSRDAYMKQKHRMIWERRYGPVGTGKIPIEEREKQVPDS